MAWNGSGTFSLADTVTANTPATATEVNAIFNDLANGINAAIAKNGENAFTGQIKSSNGTVSAPGVSFGSDLNMGFYRIGSDNLGLALNGAKVVDYATSGVSITGTLAASGNFAIATDKFTVNATSGDTAVAGDLGVTGDADVTGDITATGRVSENGGYVMPPATVLPYAGSTAPDGFLFCYGQAVSRTTYADLFDVIGETYGAGDESTTFNLPDLRGRVVAGQDDMGGTSANRLTNQSGGLNGDTLGATGGSETHTLTIAEMPAHTHGVDGLNDGSGGGQRDFVGSGASIQSGSTGGGSAHNNVQPTIILNFIIKT